MEKYSNLSGSELYDKAIQFNPSTQTDEYIIYMIMAANKNHIKAQEEFYNFNTFMPGVTAKIKEFIAESSVDQTNIYSQFISAIISQRFNDKKLSSQQITDIYTHCANQGNTCAMLELGLIMEKTDYAKAIELFQKATDLGNHGGLTSLGFMHEHGRGFPRSTYKARKLYELAINKGNIAAISNLEYLCEDEEENISDDVLIKIREIYESEIEKNRYSFVKKLYELYKIHEREYTKLGINKEYIAQYIITHKTQISAYPIFTFLVGSSLLKLCESKIALEKEVNELKMKINHLNKENSDLKIHIALTPEGKKYLEIKKEWEIY